MSRKVVRGTSTPGPGHASGGSGCTSRPAAKRLLRGKPKRTSFPCVASGRTFPTQQAMAGHSSTHSRARLRGELLPDGVIAGAHRGRRGVHGQNDTNHTVPAAVVPRPSYLPFVHRHPHHHMSNKLARVPPCVQLLYPNTPLPDVTVLHTTTAFQTAARHVQAMQLGWGAFFAHYTLLPLPQSTTSSVPVLSHTSSSASQQVRVDLTLQLGSGGGNSAQRRKIFLPSAGDGCGGKAAVAMYGGGPGSEVRKDSDGFDLELRL